MVTHVVKNPENFEIIYGFEGFRLERYKSLNVAAVFFSPYFAFLPVGSLLIQVRNGLLGQDCLVQ